MMVILLSSARMNEADQTLIKMYRETEDKALIGELFNRHSGFVLAVCMKYVQDTALAEELTVEIFESLFKKLKKHKVDYFKTWLYSVAKNHCLLHHRSANTFRKHKGLFQQEQDGFMESEESMYLSEENKKVNEAKDVQNALEQLKPEQKICVELFYIENKTYEEISRESEYNIKKVKSYIQNGKRNLKLILEGKK
ncbi:MAG: sigma-70 family RNA polymerase sigma factor [Bacteroidota bacterium]|nr:sigma-70 family RNA polymerase sigma factor [Bacteroidota bacterium]